MDHELRSTLNLFSFTCSIDSHLRLLSEISLIFALYPRRDICGNLLAPLWGISDVQKTTSSRQMPREQGEIECQECFELTEL